MSYRDIIAMARNAEDTGDFSSMEEMSARFLSSSQERWASHEAQDQKWYGWKNKPWWKKVFSRKPFGFAMPGRVGAASNLLMAENLCSAVAKRDVKPFTDRR